VAAGTLPAPGTKLGPCADACEHRDCAQTRAEAEQTCRVCDKPIGYETRFYVDSIQRAVRKLVHAACLEAEAEEPAGLNRLNPRGL